MLEFPWHCKQIWTQKEFCADGALTDHVLCLADRGKCFGTWASKSGWQIGAVTEGQAAIKRKPPLRVLGTFSQFKSWVPI